jgi:hypothetical protein
VTEGYFSPHTHTQHPFFIRRTILSIDGSEILFHAIPLPALPVYDFPVLWKLFSSSQMDCGGSKKKKEIVPIGKQGSRSSIAQEGEKETSD